MPYDDHGGAAQEATVVRLGQYREAVRAAHFLRGCLHDPAWLRNVLVEVGEQGDAQVVVALVWETPLIRRCLPTSVNGLPVVLRVMP